MWTALTRSVQEVAGEAKNSRVLVKLCNVQHTMNVTARTEYACIAVMDLATSYGSGDPVRIGRIAETHGIPARFLVQILLQLKSAGMVSSTRGATGGYKLIRDPKEVSLGEVMSVVEGSRGLIESSATVKTPISDSLAQAWTEVATTEKDMLDAITLADLLEEATGQTEDMYYI